MKSYIFPYYVSFGKGDNTDGCVTVELTDEEAVRLENSAHEKSRWRLSEDPALEDIFDKVYKKLIEAEIQNILENDDFIDDLREDFDESDEEGDYEFLEDYFSSLDIGINFPEELQEIV